MQLIKFQFVHPVQYGGAVVAVGIITALTPHMTSFTQYLCGAVFSGFSSAFIDSVTNLVVLELWSLNSKVYMQIAHGAFTVGRCSNFDRIFRHFDSVPRETSVSDSLAYF